ncbi:MAG: 50S ribosomal protein L4 [Candidatus Dojkabacteria bacterium]|jgi:large subunit ribosomal protein L4|nr:50S ribosomal protein L4 [Candidatus Dojkabacteria bacterium]
MAETKKVTTKETKLNPMVWDIPYNGDLIAQVLYVFASNERKGTSSVKGKGDVSGGGKKPWKQKGTGRARSGSIRSPLWVGGGVTFGPNNRNWKRSINKKMVQKALCMMLSQRNKEELVKFVNIDSEKELKDLRVSIDKEASKKSLLISDSEKASLALRNVKTFKVVTPMGVNLKDIVAARNILVDMDGLNILEKRLTNGK